jgi:sugar phosphate isomerase/epimerase
MACSRREFVSMAAATALCGPALLDGEALRAQTLKLPLAIQLYSVRDLLPKDFAGTLTALSALGYREVEAAGYYDHSVEEVKKALDGAGLKLVSAHYSFDDLHKQFDQIVAFNQALGVSTLICSTPAFKDPSRLDAIPPRDRNRAYTLDDWRWNADQFNQFGEKVHAAGMKFGYHNHTMEFQEIDGVAPYAELLRLTDPAKVTMEMDCGWVVVGGGDPVEYLAKYPTRISMLHVKDFKRPDPASGRRGGRAAELGQGYIDYRPLFAAAAKAGHVTHCFVEQEGFDMPPMDSLKIDADYMRGLGVG